MYNLIQVFSNNIQKLMEKNSELNTKAAPAFEFWLCYLLNKCMLFI